MISIIVATVPHTRIVSRMPMNRTFLANFNGGPTVRKLSGAQQTNGSWRSRDRASNELA